MIRSFLKNLKLSYYLKKSSPVFLYHHVGEVSDIGFNKGSKIHAVSKEVFFRQIESLVKIYRFIHVDEFIERIKLDQGLQGLAALTFDDGFYSIKENVLPILRHFGVPATVFLNSSLVKGEPFWRDQVRKIIEKNLEKEFIEYAGLTNKDIFKVKTFYEDTKDPTKIRSINILSLQSLLNSFSEKFFTKGQPIYLSKDELLDISEPLIMWGNHTSRHFVLSGIEKNLQFQEIKATDDFLSNTFPKNKISKIFSIPFGSPSTFDDETLKILNQLEYKGFLFTSQKDYFQPGKVKTVKSGLNAPIGYCRFLPKQANKFYQSYEKQA